MPYRVTKSDRCPVARPWGVVKESDGEVVGCHPTQQEANEQLAALYANETRSVDDYGELQTRAQEFLAGLPKLRE